MSKLYASLSSDTSRTEATRRGHKYLTTHTRGWDLGVRVTAHIDDNGIERFLIHATSGSNDTSADVFLGCVRMFGQTRAFVDARGDSEAI